MYMCVHTYVCRFLKHNLRDLHYIAKDLDAGNVCPACPKVLVLAVDGTDVYFYNATLTEKWKISVHNGWSSWSPTKKECWD